MKSITKWRKRKANEEHKCILCGESIPAGEEYLRPPLESLHGCVSPCHKTTWLERRPYFHKDCFCYLRNGFNPAVPVYEWKNYAWVPVPNRVIKSWCQCTKGR
jgi:hypothetical protein